MHIRIKNTPSGIGPDEVRRGWIGIELDFICLVNPDNNGIVCDSQTLTYRNCPNPPPCPPGYLVSGQDALEALKHHGPDAYAWFEKNQPFARFGNMVFPKDDCEEVA